jgi:hypothetical protein
MILTPFDALLIKAVVERLAADVWDEFPLTQHIHHVAQCSMTLTIAPTPPVEQAEQRLTAVLAELLGFDTMDGSYTAKEYLDSTGWFHGWSHLRYIETFRIFLQDNAPERDGHDYAKARRPPARTT